MRNSFTQKAYLVRSSSYMGYRSPGKGCTDIIPFPFRPKLRIAWESMRSAKEMLLLETLSLLWVIKVCGLYYSLLTLRPYQWQGLPTQPPGLYVNYRFNCVWPI